MFLGTKCSVGFIPTVTCLAQCPVGICNFHRALQKNTPNTQQTPTLHFNFHLNAAAVIYAALASEPTG